MKIRNFVIVAHIDHGKSTLADRFLETTGTIAGGKMRPQFLDMMDLEREKGITIKMQPVRMDYKLNNEDYVLNLIDTPGHVDFSYEVSRSLVAVEGAVLLVDATKGVQAQTLANLELAKQQGIAIVPAINKIDLPQARVEETIEEVANLLNITKEEIILVSAKSGKNVSDILQKVIEKVPCPNPENNNKSLRALIFDSKFDSYKGIIAYVRIVDGKIKTGDKISLFAAKASGEAKEVGYFKPELLPQKELFAGEIGYIATGIKEPDKVRVGDTLVLSGDQTNNPLHGYKEVKPMVFASLYPETADDFDTLKDALSRLKLNDPALTYEPETKEALGRGFRCGFLGTLHTEIVSERLHREFNLNLVISTPSVVYKVFDNLGKERLIYTASSWPDPSQIKYSEEPWVLLDVLTPLIYIGPMSEVLKNMRGAYIDTKYLGLEKVILSYEAPFREIITGLYDKIKGVSQGYASMNYKFLEYRPGNLVKLDVLIAGEKEEAFSKIVPEERATSEGRQVVEKIKEFLPPQQFAVAIQAAIGGKIVARETMKAQRKDVTGYLYGGDYTRKRKLLEKQKKGKKLLKATGKIRVPPKVFLEVFRG